MLNPNHPNEKCSRRGQTNFENQILLKKLSAKKNHSRHQDEPCRRNPFHRVNHLVIERKMIDEQNGNARTRVKNERRPAGPEVNPNLINTQAKRYAPKKRRGLNSDLPMFIHPN